MVALIHILPPQAIHSTARHRQYVPARLIFSPQPMGRDPFGSHTDLLLISYLHYNS